MWSSTFVSDHSITSPCDEWSLHIHYVIIKMYFGTFPIIGDDPSLLIGYVLIMICFGTFPINCPCDESWLHMGYVIIILVVILWSIRTFPTYKFEMAVTSVWLYTVPLTRHLCIVILAFIYIIVGASILFTAKDTKSQQTFEFSFEFFLKCHKGFLSMNYIVNLTKPEFRHNATVKLFVFPVRS